jgi:excisionase family DNA binding protein
LFTALTALKPGFLSGGGEGVLVDASGSTARCSIMIVGFAEKRRTKCMTTDLISAIADAVAAKLQPKSPRKLYDLKAASEYLGLPSRSVYKLIRGGKIPRVKLSEEARRVLVDVADLDRIIEQAKELAL